MNKLTHSVHATISKVKSKQNKSAKRSLLEGLFNDYYDRRRDIYKMSFVKGILLGLGSALGGTVVLAIIVWIATMLLGPSIGDWLNQFKQQ